MSLNRDQIRTLADVLGRTREHELTCDEWLAEVPAYLEAGPNERDAAAFRFVREHLGLCPDCREEVELLLAALSSK